MNLARHKLEIPRLFGLEPVQVRQMVQDLVYINRGYRVIMAVDVYDLIEYCFPINPTDKRQSVDPDDLAESQAGLSYLFSPESDERPFVLLTPEYHHEFKRVMRAIQHRSYVVHEHVEMIESLIKAGDLEDISEQKRKDLEDVVKNSFQFLLAVMLGIHSAGVDLMRGLLDKVLLTSLFTAVYPEDRQRIEKLWQGYQRKHFDKIYKILQQENKKGDPKKRKSPQAIEDDAQAIDRLIYMNQEVELAVASNRLKRGYLFLYVSSASRSEKVFNHPEIRALLPQVRKRRKFNFLRNRRQVLTYVIYRSRSKKKLPDRTIETIEDLKKLHRLICSFRNIKPILDSHAHRCHDCPLDGKTPTKCEHKNACLDIVVNANQINQKQKEIINWSLYDQVSSYSHLLHAEIDEYFPGSNPFQGYMDLFENLLESSRLRNIALKRMYERHFWITRSSKWMISRYPVSNELRDDMRSDRDAVRGIDQYLPTLPQFSSPACKEIMDLILTFYRQPSKKGLVDGIFDKFHMLDPEKDNKDEYDLLLSYFYLVFGYEGKRIHDDICKTLLPKRQHAKDKIWQECLYVLCWSARRFGLFDDAEAYAGEGLAKFPNDPRLHHGWALAVFAKYLKNKPSHHSLDEVVAASERALELYVTAGNTEQIAVSHNNIAFMLTYAVQHSDSSDHQGDLEKLSKARRHLDQLKSVHDKNQWSPDHPEFFHTEGFLEFLEAYKNWTRMNPKDVKALLNDAKINNRTALELLECDRYKKLKTEINDFYVKALPAALR